MQDHANKLPDLLVSLMESRQWPRFVSEETTRAIAPFIGDTTLELLQSVEEIYGDMISWARTFSSGACKILQSRRNTGSGVVVRATHPSTYRGSTSIAPSSSAPVPPTATIRGFS
jgi:hypothetical protein